MYPSYFICKVNDSLFLSDTNEMKVKMSCHVTLELFVFLSVLVLVLWTVRMNGIKIVFILAYVMEIVLNT